MFLFPKVSLVHPIICHTILEQMSSLKTSYYFKVNKQNKIVLYQSLLKYYCPSMWVNGIVEAERSQSVQAWDGSLMVRSFQVQTWVKYICCKKSFWWSLPGLPLCHLASCVLGCGRQVKDAWWEIWLKIVNDIFFKGVCVGMPTHFGKYLRISGILFCSQFSLCYLGNLYHLETVSVFTLRFSLSFHWCLTDTIASFRLSSLEGRVSAVVQPAALCNLSPGLPHEGQHTGGIQILTAPMVIKPTYGHSPTSLLWMGIMKCHRGVRTECDNTWKVLT